jgi:hypothetical protein
MSENLGSQGGDYDIAVSWHVTSCFLVEIYRRSEASAASVIRVDVY